VDIDTIFIVVVLEGIAKLYYNLINIDGGNFE